MIEINKEKIDLVLYCEEYTNIQKIIDCLTLDIHEIMVICPQLFLERFIQANHEDFGLVEISKIEESIINNYINTSFIYKRKVFTLHFILIHRNQEVINHPFDGDKIINTGINKIFIK